MGGIAPLPGAGSARGHWHRRLPQCSRSGREMPAEAAALWACWRTREPVALSIWDFSSAPPYRLGRRARRAGGGSLSARAEPGWRADRICSEAPCQGRREAAMRRFAWTMGRGLLVPRLVDHTRRRDVEVLGAAEADRRAVRGSPDPAHRPTGGLKAKGRPSVRDSAGSGDPRRARWSGPTGHALH
jgi:hypothetical protein